MKRFHPTILLSTTTWKQLSPFLPRTLFHTKNNILKIDDKTHNDPMAKVKALQERIHADERTKVQEALEQKLSHRDLLETIPTDRQTVLTLYRQLHRLGKRLPQGNQRAFVRHKVRREFKRARRVQDAEKVRQLVRVAMAQVDNLEVQVEHLGYLVRDDRVVVDEAAMEKEREEFEVSQYRKDEEKSWKE